ncbi:hypothetical protein DML05_15555 [Salmonella enterica]|uniref:Uncharacterized protein n=1 Tax=Salmonella derby TaxID=28144 RepID=A0A701QPG3_SALDE|nr:hypothetical protein [Salmonella enterica subsp. enterica]EAA7925919.1 hypothetical protein [Salmonella enterica subsp. enterica serovar Kottbus]EAM9389176.1 hypothetical protein [Salmonella enterica]EBS3840486.1 hypothetical protein [Salmonella enterica subsp. enterica serovar Stanley]EBV4622736.1 hypothetical protein [Salmonella enterica subsp. enterica serovar Javiana]EBW7492736.1 hypothetical protein [Salmonella enterica subsp. enterica serovar Enteritidis]TRR07910.1 hypothetical prote
MRSSFIVNPSRWRLPPPVGFSTKQKRAPAVTAFRVDWVMSPSRGDALFCCVKGRRHGRTLSPSSCCWKSRTPTRLHTAITLWCRVPPGIWRRLHARRVLNYR